MLLRKNRVSTKLQGIFIPKKKSVNKNTFMINVLIMVINRFWKY